MPPVRPRSALGLLLRALGVADSAIPATLDARATQYQQVLAGRRVLLVLDNAIDAEQVRPPLPTTPSCLALITSRSRLTGLAVREGARLLTLDVLSPAESLSLLHQIVGDRIDREPEAAEVAMFCGYLPLALRIAAVRLVTRPSFRITDALAELASEADRIDALSRDTDEHAAVRSVFSWSYQRLGQQEQRAFRLLGLHRGPSLSEHAVAALTGSTARAADSELQTLVALHLIEEDRPRRYRIHDLLRLYAAELCQADEPPAARRAAIERILYWYVSTANAADSLLTDQPPAVAEPPNAT